MNLLFRFFWTIARALFRDSLGVKGVSRLRLRVWPTDLDLNKHMNNGRYLTIMDLGRMDFIVRSGLGRLVIRRGWRPIAGGATIRFRKGLDPFMSYELVTSLLGWDEKWFYFDQRFHKDGRDRAQALAKVTVVGEEGVVPPRTVVEAMGWKTKPPRESQRIRAWKALEDRMKEESGEGA